MMFNKIAEFIDLREKIISCQKCPRLVNYLSEVSKKKIRRYRECIYWGKPIPGFGDPNAKLLIIGLAPAAHGGNRTGRMFTGDSSGDWIIRALYKTGFSNQSKSFSEDDGLKLKLAYITAVIRCAPPKNKPLSKEIRNCSEYLIEEIRLLKNTKVVFTLGKIAFDSFIRYILPKNNKVRFKFQHGKIYKFKDFVLISSYHPSRQNTQTGKLTWSMWMEAFNKIGKIIEMK
jgi:uracil-DNA glycosylase family 4